jgi:conjugative transfer signal peptidase TraF
LRLRTPRGPRLALLLFLSTWLVALLVVCAVIQLGLRLNISPSVPLGFYRLVNALPVRGEYVALCPPPSPAFRLARLHGYLASGPCPGDFVPMVKVLAAKHGDRVSVDARGVWINDTLWPRSAPLRVDSSGWSLPRLSNFRAVLGTDEVFVMSESCRLGFDGRYFGALPGAVIIAKAVPLLTW